MINVCNCEKDGGRPSEVCIQVQTSNYLMVLRTKSVVLCDEEKHKIGGHHTYLIDITQVRQIILQKSVKLPEIEHKSVVSSLFLL